MRFYRFVDMWQNNIKSMLFLNVNITNYLG